jgi:3-oxoacyl-[acyl-carrier protein] reductase
MTSLTDQKVALVTGASKGIGAAISRRLAGDGFAVALVDVDLDGARQVAEEIRADGGRALEIKANVADEDEVEAAVARCAAELGAPLVLVNNAGILRDNALFRMATSDWDAVMNVHLRGAFLMSRATQAHMTAAGWGRIITMSSVSALGNRGQANYAAAKAGLQGFTKTLAIELGKFGVTANCIAPGYIETEMLTQTAERMGISYDEFAATIVKDVPVARMGQPEDIAAAVSFFAREDASFVTGQVLYVSGGPKA